MIRRCSLFLSMLLFVGLVELNAATLVVGPPPASIQAVINSANSGDTVQLSSGIYVEQIQIISKSINLVGTGQNTSTIMAPPPSIPLTQYFITGAIRIWPIVMIENQAFPTNRQYERFNC